MEQQRANGWFERYVTEALERIEEKVDALNEDRVRVEARLTGLEVRTTLRASLYGAIGGAVPAAVTLIYFLLR